MGKSRSDKRRFGRSRKTTKYGVCSNIEVRYIHIFIYFQKILNLLMMPRIGPGTRCITPGC